jgi:hypothetical protein
MSEPLGKCPGCGSDEPFEQIHAVNCPDVPDGECPEWACVACGAAVIMGITSFASDLGATAAAGQPVRAA